MNNKSVLRNEGNTKTFCASVHLDFKRKGHKKLFFSQLL